MKFYLKKNHVVVITWLSMRLHCHLHMLLNCQPAVSRNRSWVFHRYRTEKIKSVTTNLTFCWQNVLFFFSAATSFGLCLTVVCNSQIARPLEVTIMFP